MIELMVELAYDTFVLCGLHRLNEFVAPVFQRPPDSFISFGASIGRASLPIVSSRCRDIAVCFDHRGKSAQASL
jgi:hypothetical protein